MSFRLFIYYGALSGAGGAFAAWALGRFLVHTEGVLAQGVKGLYLGVYVALALGLVDALGSFSPRQFVAIGLRVLVAVLIGGLGGLVGGLAAEALYELLPWLAFRVLGWVLIGLLVGVSPGVFDLLACSLRGQDPGDARRKVTKGLLGGAVGGLLGGCLSVLLHGFWAELFQDRPADRLWSPSALGFVVLGACIGLLIGLTHVLLKEAWLRVEQGFRSGRELILARPEITLGRGESCDVGLFGDPGVERVHAHIRHEGRDYVLFDAGTPGGTFVNDEMLTGPRVLHSGDVIRLGRCVLRFEERRKREGP